jgi:hypothetical protein
MKCKDIQKKIDIEFSQGGVKLPEDLNSHIESCPACASYLSALARLDQVLASAPLEVRPGELDNLTFERIVDLATSKGEKTGIFANIFKPRWARKSRVLTTWILAAAAAIIIAAIYAPQIIHKSTPTTVNYTTDFYLPSDADLEATLLSSDTLTDQFLSTLAGNSTDLDQVNDELMSGANINDIINSLSNNELEALYKKLDNLKG